MEMKFKPRKFEALVDQFGLDDGGCASFTFEVQELKKGKIYMESNPNHLQSSETGVVIDDNSCWHIVGTKEFEKRFKEILE